MLYKSQYNSPIGTIYLAAIDTALVGAWFEKQKHFAEKIIDEAVLLSLATSVDSSGNPDALSDSTILGDSGMLSNPAMLSDSKFANESDRAKVIIHMASNWLGRYFNNERPAIEELPLAPQGSQFRQDVWKFLKEIPYGQTVTYGDIAKQLAVKYGKERMSAQAVGAAVGHNPLSIIVPCHRVVGAGGNLTGYAGGVDLKVKLLEHEGVDMRGFWYKG